MLTAPPAAFADVSLMGVRVRIEIWLRYALFCHYIIPCNIITHQSIESKTINYCKVFYA